MPLNLDHLITKLYTAQEKSPGSKAENASELDAVCKNTLQLQDSPNYHNFENINDAYSNFIQKVMDVIDLAASIKSVRKLRRMVRR